MRKLSLLFVTTKAWNFLKAIRLRFRSAGSQFWLFIKNEAPTLGVISTTIVIVLSYISIQESKKALEVAREENARAKLLFPALMLPAIDVVPTGIRQNAVGNDKYAEVRFSVVNSTGFPAYNISVSFKYGPYGWISEWVKAYQDHSKQQGVVTGKLYGSQPNPSIARLNPGESVIGVGTRGALTLDTDVCNQPNGLPILIRITWENENGHVFDEIKEYSLLCTKYAANEESGRAFTFIPKQTESHRPGR